MMMKNAPPPFTVRSIVSKAHYNPDLDRIRQTIGSRSVQYIDRHNNLSTMNMNDAIETFANNNQHQASNTISNSVHNEPQIDAYQIMRQKTFTFPHNKQNNIQRFRSAHPAATGCAYTSVRDNGKPNTRRVSSRKQRALGVQQSMAAYDINNSRMHNDSQQILKHYNMHGHLASGGGRPLSRSNSTAGGSSTMRGGNVETYRAANGAIYKQFETKDSYVRVIDYPTKNCIHVPGKYHEQFRQKLTSDEVPQNLRHKFGTNDTDKLLDDQLKVHDTLSSIYNSGLIKKSTNQEEPSLAPPKPELVVSSSNTPPSKQKKSSKSTKPPLDADKYPLDRSQYNELGNNLRFTICHGLPQTYKFGHKEAVHNLAVSKEFLSDPKNTESKYRRQKDWLSKWKECDVVRAQIESDMARKVADIAACKKTD